MTFTLLLAATLAAQTPTDNDLKREKSMRLADIFAAMQLKPGAEVADIGAGDGWVTTRIAKAVGPQGRVYAVDIDAKRALPALRKLARAHKNIKVIASAPVGPKELRNNNLFASG